MKVESLYGDCTVFSTVKGVDLQIQKRHIKAVAYGYSMTNYNKRNIEAVAYGYSKTNYNKRHIEAVAYGYSKTNFNK